MNAVIGQHCQERGRRRDPPEDPALCGDHLQADALELGEVGADAVRQHQALVAAVVGLADGGVHADLGGHAGHHQAGDAALLEQLPERRAVERPLARLVDHRLVGQRREVVDDVVAVLAADQDAALGARCADAQARIAPVELGGRAVRQVGDVPLPRVDHGEAHRPGGLQHLLERGDDGLQVADVVAERLAEAARLDEVALHVDDHQRGGGGVERERVRLCRNGVHDASSQVVASMTDVESDTQPNTPPCMVTMCSAAAWLPGSVAPVQSDRIRHS